MLIYSFYSFDSIYSFELIFLNAPPSTHLSCFTDERKPNCPQVLEDDAQASVSTISCSQSPSVGLLQTGVR